MEEIKVKVGEFIRTIHGEIRKISKIIPPEAMGNDETELYELDKKCLGYKYTDNKKLGKFSHTERAEIKKHSPNIIDLIEKDDYINGCRVYKVEEHGVTVYQQTEDGVIDYNWICRSDIKSIVTHESFNSIKYEVE